jgi:uncharacterized membrane protein YeiH
MDITLQTQVIYIASIIGGIAFALSGFLAGIRKELDIMGLFVLAFLTANGGGILRDVLIDRVPTVLQSTEPFWLTAGVVIFAGFLRVHRFATLERRWLFVICDAVGLVAFGITGALIAIDENIHFFGILTLSFLTATGGGILRDVLVNNVPEVLHSGFYGSIAILLGLGIYFLHTSDLLNPLTLLLVFALSLSTRLTAYRFGWKLPKLKKL